MRKHKYQFGEEFGLKTAVVLIPLLEIWNGYVGLPLGHPLYGLELDNVDDLANVHGGITWADCSLPGREPDGNWWLGFDTAHHGDTIPGIDNLPAETRDRIKKRAREFVAALFEIDPEELDQMDEVEPEFKDARYVAAEVSFFASQLSVMNLDKGEANGTVEINRGGEVIFQPVLKQIMRRVADDVGWLHLVDVVRRVNGSSRVLLGFLFSLYERLVGRGRWEPG